MGWTLMRGSTELARLELQGTDMPWFLCSFHAGPAYADVEPLFVEQERLLETEDWDGAEHLWERMHSQMTLLPNDKSERPISEFLLRIEGDEARLRY
jgi:hypothetical protein